MKDFCNALHEVGVEYELDNSKIKFKRTQRSKFFGKRESSYILKFYGWTRPIEAGAARDTFDNLNLTEDYPNYQSVLEKYREPFYSLIKEYEVPLRRLKDK